MTDPKAVNGNIEEQQIHHDTMENIDEEYRERMSRLNTYFKTRFLNEEKVKNLDKSHFDDLWWQQNRIEKQLNAQFAKRIENAKDEEEQIKLKGQMEIRIAALTNAEAKKQNVEQAQERIKNNNDYIKEARKSNKILNKEEKAALKQAKKDNNQAAFDALKTKQRLRKDDLKKAKAENKQYQKEIMENAPSKEEGYKQRLEADETDNGAAMGLWAQQQKDALKGILTGQTNISKQLVQMFESNIEDYASYQAKANARLQGSTTQWNNGGVGSTLMNKVGATPYVKLSELLKNASEAVDKGIAVNIEQRAFLESIKDDIAATFDAFDSNLLRIVRLQQSDSTAARMGLEANLNQLFNTYFSDSSYLSDAFDSVSQGLTEAIAQMGTEEGVAFEYQVQKWLGSLYSVGFDASTIGNIATALGQLGSGDVSGLSGNSAMQNLIVMAASRAGLSYADMLTQGLDASTTNKLLESMVEYLQEIATSDNKVVKSQYSQIFGLTASDLKAAQNLGGTIQELAGIGMTYEGAISELYDQVAELPNRLSAGEMTNNMIDNVKYAISAGIADNPATYAMWELTSMIEGLSGGLNLPTIYAFGNGVDIGTTITNLMRLGVVGAGALGNIGTIINGIGNSINPVGILEDLGITKQSNAISRGSGFNSSNNTKMTKSASRSQLVGNTSGEDYSESVVAQANQQKEDLLRDEQENSKNKTLDDIHEYLVRVFDPKVTDIEVMLGSLAGFSVGKSIAGTYVNPSGNEYMATAVTISGGSETNMANENMENMRTIRDNTSAILALLQSVVSGASAFKTVGGLTSSQGGIGF